MPIRYYEGVEGSGKSCMMARDLFLHYRAGGRVLSFPGFELYGDNKKQVLSELFMPEQILSLLKQENTKVLRKQKIAIAGDEITNFFNHHTWYNKICDIVYAVMAERRKLGIAFLMTGPLYHKLPPDLRDMIHEIIHCQDNHTLNHAIPRGEKCIYYKEDLRGLLSNPKHRFSRKKVMSMKQWYTHYDTYAATDSLHQFVRVKVKGRTVVYDENGEIINNGYESPDEATLNKYIKEYNEQNQVKDPRENVIKQLIHKIGKNPIASSLIYDVLKAKTQSDKILISRIMQQQNFIYNRLKKQYVPIMTD